MTHDRPPPSESDPETGRAELRCSVCGYGVIASGPPLACPMCQASAWESFPGSLSLPRIAARHPRATRASTSRLR